MFICSKLRQNLSEMEVRTFTRIQRVIWDHLVPFKCEISQKQALFSFQWIIIMLSVLFFLSFSFLAYRVQFFCLNHIRKVQKRWSHSRFSSPAIILGYFYRNVGLCCSCFFGCCGRPWLLRRVKQWREMKKILINSGLLPFCWNLNKIL